MEHRPVLLNEALRVLRPRAGVRILDATFGRGGHSRALLEAGAAVWALDRDPEAVAVGRRLESEWLGKFRIMKKNFREIGDVVKEEGAFDGLLLDLGVSSPQLDTAGRGFSFQQDGPLDMRMDTESDGRTAADLVNNLSEGELSKIFFEYGEESGARRVARAIVREREKALLKRTGELAAIVEKSLGGRRDRKIHPATKTFQALRIVVNDELGALEDALEAVPAALNSGGRLAVISFHALEDRMVKRFVERRSREEITGERYAFGRPNPDYCLRSLGRWLPTEEEVEDNPRARSARIRGAEKI